MTTQRTLMITIIALLAIATLIFIFGSGGPGSATNSIVVKEADSPEQNTNEDSGTPNVNDDAPEASDPSAFTNTMQTSREVRSAERLELPLTGSAPTEDVLYSIPIKEIHRGCFRQDCIPSVDDPQFVSTGEADDLLPDDTIGIGLSYNGVDRFYPFNMLVTREIVNDIVAGDPLLVTYCPLCGTGVVFERRLDGTTFEFGVSGMLWQSNLLMYNRAERLEDRSLWSQVLGEAVVGAHTGTKLAIVPSDIVRYPDWRAAHPGGEVLNTGRIGDPYGGDYYGVARNFDPNFDESSSPLPPTAYVLGIEIDGEFKAYPRETLPVGTTADTFAGTTLTIEKSDTNVVGITDETGREVPTIEGFWFSWVAAHPDTALWEN